MPLLLRADLDAVHLRTAARKAKDAGQARRLLALAAIYDGATRSEAAKTGGVTPQIIRDWVIRLNARGIDGLVDRKAPGQPSRLNEAHREALAAMIESGPTPAVHGVLQWRIIDLCQWMGNEFGINVAKPTMSRELRAMGYRKLPSRPRRRFLANAATHFSKGCSPFWAKPRTNKTPA